MKSDTPKKSFLVVVLFCFFESGKEWCGSKVISGKNINLQPRKVKWLSVVSGQVRILPSTPEKPKPPSL